MGEKMSQTQVEDVVKKLVERDFERELNEALKGPVSDTDVWVVAKFKAVGITGVEYDAERIKAILSEGWDISDMKVVRTSWSGTAFTMWYEVPNGKGFEVTLRTKARENLNKAEYEKVSELYDKLWTKKKLEIVTWEKEKLEKEVEKLEKTKDELEKKIEELEKKVRELEHAKKDLERQVADLSWYKEEYERVRKLISEIVNLLELYKFIRQ